MSGWTSRIIEAQEDVRCAGGSSREIPLCTEHQPGVSIIRVHLKVRLEPGEMAGKVGGLTVEGLDIGGFEDPPRLGDLSVSKATSRICILLAYEGDLGQSHVRSGRRRVQPGSLGETLLRLLEVVAAKETIAQHQELRGAGRILGPWIVHGLRRPRWNHQLRWGSWCDRSLVEAKGERRLHRKRARGAHEVHRRAVGENAPWSRNHKRGHPAAIPESTTDGSDHGWTPMTLLPTMHMTSCLMPCRLNACEGGPDHQDHDARSQQPTQSVHGPSSLYSGTDESMGSIIATVGGNVNGCLNPISPRASNSHWGRSSRLAFDETPSPAAAARGCPRKYSLASQVGTDVELLAAGVVVGVEHKVRRLDAAWLGPIKQADTG